MLNTLFWTIINRKSFSIAKIFKNKLCLVLYCDEHQIHRLRSHVYCTNVEPWVIESESSIFVYLQALLLCKNVVHINYLFTIFFVEFKCQYKHLDSQYMDALFSQVSSRAFLSQEKSRLLNLASKHAPYRIRQQTGYTWRNILQIEWLYR